MRILPRCNIGCSAGREGRRIEVAAVRRGAGVLIDPERDGTEVLRGDLLADVLDSGDGLAGAIVDRLAAGIDAREIP